MRKSLFILPLLVGASLSAQENKEDVFDFTSNYKAKVEEADKISLNPTSVDTIKTEVDLKYSVVPKHVDTEYEPKEIPPVKMKVNTPLKKLKKHYVSLGLGRNAFPEFVYGYNLTRNKEHYFSLIAKHYSAKTDIADYTDVGDVQNTLMQNSLAVSYKRMKHKYTFYGNLDYSFDSYSLYGNDLTTLPIAGVNTLDIVSFSRGKANIGYLSNYKDSSKINHQIDLSYLNFFDDRNNMEHQILINGDLKKWIDKDLLRVDINALYYSGFANINEVTTFDLVPTLERTKGKLSIELGGGISGNLTPAGSKVMLVPRVDASYQVVNKVLNVFAIAAGGYDRVSYSGIIGMNPYSRFDNGLMTTKTLLDFSAGVRGAFSKRMTYKVAFNYSSKENDLLFIGSNDVENGFQLDLLYDNIKLNQINAEISHDGEKWKNVLYGELNSYNTEVQLNAWHRPSYQLKYNTTYSLQDKIKVGADVFLVADRSVPTNIIGISGPINVITLDPFVDLNFNVKYNYNKNLQAFVRLNNVLNNGYQMWQNYPNFGFNFLAGANYKF